MRNWASSDYTRTGLRVKNATGDAAYDEYYVEYVLERRRTSLHASALAAALRGAPPVRQRPVAVSTASTLRLELVNGSRIISLPAQEEASRASHLTNTCGAYKGRTSCPMATSSPAK